MSTHAFTIARQRSAPRVRFYDPYSPTARMLRRFVRHRMAVLGLIVLIAFVLLALFAPFVAPSNPNRGDLRQIDLAPSLEHPLGTDGVGRDYWTRLVYGAR